MVSIGVGSSLCQTPAASRISRLACDSAMGRNGGFPAGNFLSARDTLLPAAWSKSASAQATGPPPRTKTSVRIALEGLDIRDALGRFGGDQFAAALGDQRVILDAHADAAQRRRDIVRGAYVKARFHREHHSRRERAPFAG